MLLNGQLTGRAKAGQDARSGDEEPEATCLFRGVRSNPSGEPGDLCVCVCGGFLGSSSHTLQLTVGPQL